MILSDVAVKRPVFAAVVSLLLVAFGLVSFTRLPLRELPDIDRPEVSIDIVYRGASAEVIETRVTDVIEDRLTGIEGVETITSTTRDGNAGIELQFKLWRDLDEAANDVRDAVSRAIDSLPDEVDPPEVRKANADERPILWFNLASDELNELELTDYAQRVLVDRLTVVDGVARVRLGGEQLYSMRVWIDRLALAARGLTVVEVENALRAQNIELPAGQIEGFDRDFTVRVERSYAREEDFQRLVIGEGADGQLVRLGDVAEVEVGPRERRNLFRGNGKSMIGLGIIAQSKTNILDVASGVKDVVEQVKTNLPETIGIYDSFDSSVFVEESVREIWRTLAVAVALVVLVIYLFLGNIRAAAVPAVVVPVCLVATFTVLAAAGYSINLITLLALILSIGLVVDDSIVVLENIQRRVDEGEEPVVGAFLGARQVGFAVIATTVVLISVFVSLAFQQGFVGKLFQELAVTISAAVAFSSLVALTLSPMMCSKLLKSRASYHAAGKRRRNPIARWFGGRVDAAAELYANSLTLVVGRPLSASAVMVGMVAFMATLAILLPKDLAPAEDRGGFFVFAEAPEGAGFDYTAEQLLQVEDVLMRYAPVEEGGNGEARRILIRVPGWGGRGYNSGIAIVNLAPFDERRSADAILADVRRELAEIPGVFARAGMRSSIAGGDGGGDVGFVLLGTEYGELNAWADTLMSEAARWPGIQYLRKDFKPTNPRLAVSVDRDRAADLGVSVQDVGRTLETMLGSREVGTYVHDGEEYDVLVQAQLGDRRTPQDLVNIFVRSRSGALVPLSNLISVSEYADSAERNHFNKIRSITLQGAITPGYTQADALEFLEGVVAEQLPTSAQYDYTGGSRQYQESSNSFLFVLVMALIVVYLVLAAQFESLIHPIVIMLTVPVAAVGGLFGLYVAGDAIGSINIYSQIGLLILVGLAAKNGILIVEFANQLRDEGRSVRDAIMEATRVRFRPVLMTGISTAMGALPLMLSSGAGAESRQTIGVTVVAGTMFGTLLTLYVIPVFYDALGRFTKSPGRIARLLNQTLAARERELRGAPQAAE